MSHFHSDHTFKPHIQKMPGGKYLWSFYNKEIKREQYIRCDKLLCGVRTDDLGGQ